MLPGLCCAELCGQSPMHSGWLSRMSGEFQAHTLCPVCDPGGMGSSFGV